MQRTVIVRREVTDHEAVEIALVENLQREDLSPIEEAEAYRALIAATGCSQQDLAGAVGKSEAYISHTLRSLKLPEPVRRRLEGGELSARHGRHLVTAAEPGVPCRRSRPPRPECPANRIACAEALSASRAALVVPRLLH